MRKTDNLFSGLYRLGFSPFKQTITALIWLVLSFEVAGADLTSANQAYESGDLEAAFAAFAELAEQGDIAAQVRLAAM